MNLCVPKPDEYSKDDSRGYSSDQEARDLIVDSFVDTKLSFSIAARRGIRRGVKAKDIPHVWLEANKKIPLLYRIDVEYFVGAGRHQDNNDSPSLLSTDGSDIKHRLVAAIPNFFSYVEFCPFLTPLIEAVLSFHDLPDTALIISRLLSRIKIRENRIFMFCKWTSFKDIVGYTYSAAVRRIPEISKSPFLLDWIAKHLSNGCARIFPFGLFVRMAGCVLFEGCKVIARYLLAALSIAIAPNSKPVESSEELDTIVAHTATKRGMEIARLAFKLSLSFRGTIPLPDPSAILSQLTKDDFQFFGDAINYDGFREAMKNADPVILARKFTTVFKAKTDGFSNRLFKLKMKEGSAVNMVLLVTTKICYRGFYLVDDIRQVFDEDKALFRISKDQIPKFIDGRFFIGGLLTIDSDMKEAAGDAFKESSAITDLELILVDN